MQNADFISIYKGFDAFDCAQFSIESYQLLEVHKGVIRHGRRLPSAGGMWPSDFTKEGDAMVTYDALFQFGILIVAIIGLSYKIFHKK